MDSFLDRPDPKNPKWSQKICFEAWRQAIVGSNFASACCLCPLENTFITTTPYNWGPFIGNIDFWNCEQFIKLRKSLLESGSLFSCKNSLCRMNIFENETMLSSYLFTRNMLGKEIANCIANQILNEQVVLDHPWQTTIEITRQCSNNCAFCCQKIAENLSILPPPEKTTHNHIINFINRCSLAEIYGGEVLELPEDILKEYVEKTKTNVKLVTNGKKLTLDMYEFLCVNGPFKTISISLNTMTKKEYLQGGDSARKNVFKTREHLNAIVSKYPNHCIRSFFVVITRSILPLLPEIVDFGAQYGVKTIIFLKLFPDLMVRNGLGYEDIGGEGFSMEVYEQYMRYTEDARRRAKELNIFLCDSSLYEHMKRCKERFFRNPFHQVDPIKRIFDIQ